MKKIPHHTSALFAEAFFVAAFFAVVVFFAVVFFAAVVFLAVAVFFAAAVFFAVVFFAAADFFGFSSASAGACSLSPSAAGFFTQPPRFSSGVKLLHSSLIQYGFFAPRPDFLNIVQPHIGQLSFTGTSQDIKSHRRLSSLLFKNSQQ